ncbi:pseudouridine-5'-phosphate glycosidase [Trichonephila clavata]|uniref:Pseudouridine-5'-phosphate glycosidase n=1 Tax=Trichonephila clavata TaxID=2740835 RepID=A0A8X6KWY3_TRICU|nr:pseudouridine-5'-phosphate glycosidase [Trichonephila clavata]
MVYKKQDILFLEKKKKSTNTLAKRQQVLMAVISDIRSGNAEEIDKNSRDRLQLESGVLIAVPIPEEYHEDGFKTESVIEEALREAREKNVSGKDVTPFVLSKVRELSEGASLKANIGLLLNNARVGTQIAVELNALKNPSRGSTSSRILRAPITHEAKNVFSSRGRPVVIGGSILDIHVKALEDVTVSLI